MHVIFAAYRACYKTIVAENFSNPILYHRALAAKEARTAIGISNELGQFSLALDQDRDAFFGVVKEAAMYCEVEDDGIEDI